ncbi:MAG: amino acid ABC transporter substrate-binding protein [Thermomicrobiales bacterium]|nr:amino acid ABC transporter substrate-binding protein [Thermomicrobiales bacterium]MCO5222156.1 ABC transporter substrate-binding protein [Thermomicrobiales bacterium]
MITRRKFIPAAAGVVALGKLGAVGAQDASPVASPVVASIDELPLRNAGKLTVHADQPLYAPWFIDNDPTNGQGFESALTYKIAERLGFTADQVEWGYTSFNASYAPGPKDFDFYITEVSITETRAEAVDFSDPYYSSPLVLLAVDGSPLFEAQTLEDLKPYTFGAQVGTVYYTYIVEVIQPDNDPLIFNTNSDAIQALANGQTDADLQSLQIGQAIVTFQFDNLGIVGLLPDGETNMGMVFEQGSELVPYVNLALQSLKDDGTLDALIAEWLPIPEELREISR